MSPIPRPVLLLILAQVVLVLGDIDSFEGQTIRFKVFAKENRNREPINLKLFRPNPELDVLTNFSCFVNSTACTSYLILHGFQADSNSKWIEDMKNELFAYNENSVVFVVDWSRASKFSGSKYSLSSYKKAVKNTERVTEEVVEILELLLKRNFLKVGKEKSEQPLGTLHLHCIGHSLGSHVCGQIGKKIKESHLILARITGLDPAGPLFKSNDEKKKLSKEDANYVDIIHTSRQLGLVKQTGHTDFFPNDADIQPGCMNDETESRHPDSKSTTTRSTSHSTDREDASHSNNADIFELNEILEAQESLEGERRRKREWFALKLWNKGKKKIKNMIKAISCSHGRAHQYFIQSINDKECQFLSQECSNWKRFRKGVCELNRKNRMGFHSFKEESDRKYYLTVKSTFPYCELERKEH